MSKLSALLLASMLAGLSDPGRSRKSNKDRYEDAKVRTQSDNQDFAISMFFDIMGKDGDGLVSFTAGMFTDKLIAYTESQKSVLAVGSTPDEMVAYKSEVLAEITRILDYWVSENAFSRGTTNFADLPPTSTYLITDYGRGIVDGFQIGHRAQGRTAFTVLKSLTDEELEAMSATDNSDSECGCGNPDCVAPDILNAISSMGPKGPRRRNETFAEDPLDLLRRLISGMKG